MKSRTCYVEGIPHGIFWSSSSSRITLIFKEEQGRMDFRVEVWFNLHSLMGRQDIISKLQFIKRKLHGLVLEQFNQILVNDSKNKNFWENFKFVIISTNISPLQFRSSNQLILLQENFKEQKIDVNLYQIFNKKFVRLWNKRDTMLNTNFSLIKTP